MLNLAINSIKDRLENLEVDGQPLIERWGGLVFPLTRSEEIGKTDSGDGIFRDSVFPVTCGMTWNDCIGNQKYRWLTPDSRLRSIAYFEQMGDAVVNVERQKFAPKSSLNVYEIPVRFVMWMNSAKLNINGTANTDCSIVAPVMLKIQSILKRNRVFQLNNPAYPNATVEFIFTGQETKDAAKIFGRYSYGKELNALGLFPYDFFSLKYLVRLSININCVEDFNFGTPNDCPVLGTPEES